MRNTPFWWILIGLMILLDIYIFQAVRLLAQPAGQRTRLIIYSAYWSISAAALIVLLLLPYFQFSQQSRFLRSTIFAIVIGLFFAKVIAALFLLIDDIRRGIQWIAAKLLFRNTEGEELQEGTGISRSVFMSWLGIAAGSGLFATLIYGFGNKYKYRIHKVPLDFANLPQAFRGLRVVQLSDIHSGSFTDKEAVMRGVQKVLELKPDLILFTGDLVNNIAEEMKDYMDVFDKLHAPMGVYSVLGNHDYGDYAQWENAEAKKANLDELKAIHAKLGWRLLLDEHVVFERGEDKIALIGVQNISGRKSFQTYGNLSKAYAGSEAIPFKILMSHDPSHWESEVLPSYKDIDLTLSGHTHGMQFGVELPGFKWSPVQYVYKQWAGTYEAGKQHLYVNRGYGFIGYPGRVGILPEITLLEFS
ncbi:MAG: metallophosphatase [Sphingobacteriales bacterium SCN 48-20]|jgi:predicted MPP superfamily phosphohydrolase|uniref:metallophosphoesterase n=1 Tax=Terrimonas ferruginea TaxID=249 RepID=UPI00086DBEDA|nr:metallophosphoesterase [Terrimonas ferruginea]MBN8783995.1 metallophosphoesterase [Terrimonas ferruginea]ODT94179.1 MAG: metallophosphatase [Sphingobacteriales bacterium SCN 48-20]OJW41697.1 MAG: metallophosphatase [Sphingobacteriales bacterium 48-107]